MAEGVWAAMAGKGGGRRKFAAAGCPDNTGDADDNLEDECEDADTNGGGSDDDDDEDDVNDNAGANENVGV